MAEIQRRPQFRLEALSLADGETANNYFQREPKLTRFDAVAAAHAGAGDLLRFDDDPLASHSDPLRETTT